MEETYEGLYEKCPNMTTEENLRENQKYGHLMEMSVLRKNRTGLPVNIWIDEGQTFNSGGHWKRIKFQGDKGDHPNSNYMIPMTISENPEVKIENMNEIKLSNYDIELVKKFVVLNLDLLKGLGDTIDIFDFTEQMKKLD
jgi:hypothetical protein